MGVWWCLYLEKPLPLPSLFLEYFALYWMLVCQRFSKKVTDPHSQIIQYLYFGLVLHQQTGNKSQHSVFSRMTYLLTSLNGMLKISDQLTLHSMSLKFSRPL